MIKNVAIYCRVSTDEQKKFGISIDDQKNSLTEYCKQNNYKIYDYYLDNGVSAGTILKRKEFVRLLKDLDNVDLIIFTRLDRFSRNVCDANNLLLELDKHNTSFRAIDDEDIDVSTADGRFIFNLKVNLAERERKIDSERIRRANKYKYEVVKTVCTGKLPYGYKISDEKKMIIDYEKINHIKNLYDHYLKTNNLNETTKWFSQKYTPRSSKMIKRYLTNKCYIGIYKTSYGAYIYNYCEPTIDEDIFYKVQNIFSKNIKLRQPDVNRKRHNKEPYIFSGLLRCPICNSRLSGKVNTSSNHYYNCKKHEIKKCSNKKCIAETCIEEFLLKNIKKSLINKKIELQNVQENNDKEKIDINVIKNKLNKLTNLYMEDLVDKEYYKTEYNKLQSQLNNTMVNKHPKTIKKKDIERISNLLSNDFLKIYNSLNNIEKRRLWSSIIDYIIVYDKENMEIYVY